MKGQSALGALILASVSVMAACGGGGGGGGAVAADVEAPTPPLGVNAVVAPPDGATITWMPSTDDVGVVGYRVYRNGALVASVSANSTTDAALTQAQMGAGGTVLSMNDSAIHDHPGGGCRAGNDPTTSVVDTWGRAHDHENLFIVGAPTAVTGGCANGTLTYAAMSLRSAGRIAEEL